MEVKKRWFLACQLVISDQNEPVLKPSPPLALLEGALQQSS